jgi:hypothetical protein
LDEPRSVTRQPARNRSSTLFKERYEVLGTLGTGGEARVVKALDRQTTASWP